MEDKEELKEKEVVEKKDVSDKKEEVDKVEEKKPTKKKNVTLIAVLIACIVILLIAIVCVLLSSKDDKTKSDIISNDSKEYRSDYKIKGNSLDDFDLYFMKLENKEANKIYSPLSIKYALEMLAEGTSGESKKQIESVIGDYEAKKYPNNEHMSFANAMFIRNSFQENVKEEYTSLLKNKYYADVVFDSFESANTMNNWISEKTLKLINNLLSDKDLIDRNFYLVNALGIDMNWNHLIQCQGSITSVPSMYYHVEYLHEKYNDYVSCVGEESSFPSITFNGEKNIKGLQVGASFNRYDIIKELGEDYIRKTVGDAYREWLNSEEIQDEIKKGHLRVEQNVDTFLNEYMRELATNYKRTDISTDFSLYVDDDVRVFAKDLQTYDGMTLQYVGIMPQKESLKDFVEEANAKKISEYISKLKTLKLENFKDGVVTKITGKIPVFKFDYKLNFKNDLKKLGITDIFDPNKADLGFMLKDNIPQFISDAGHVANIDFSNEGIKASAVTMLGGMGGTAAAFDYLFDVPVETIDVTFDKPFMFIIRDKQSGEVWFTGNVYNPTKKAQ